MITFFLVTDAENNKYKGSIYMVFEYMDHDLTGLADRPGLRFTVPQVKVLYAVHRLVVLALMYSVHSASGEFTVYCFAVLHEATTHRSSLLSC